MVEERNLFGFDAIQFFLTKQCFCLLITTIQNGTYTSSLFKKNISGSAVFIYVKRKHLHKLKVLIFKLLKGNYLFKFL